MQRSVVGDGNNSGPHTLAGWRHAAEELGRSFQDQALKLSLQYGKSLNEILEASGFGNQKQGTTKNRAVKDQERSDFSSLFCQRLGVFDSIISIISLLIALRST